MESREREVLQARMAELADGNRGAFDDVYALVWPLVRGFVGSHLRAGEAEDAAQEALLRVFARASAFDSSRDALSWILGIAAWEIRTAKQRERRRREEGIGDAVLERPAADPRPDEVAAARERPPRGRSSRGPPARGRGHPARVHERRASRGRSGDVSQTRAARGRAGAGRLGNESWTALTA
jgi:RNA polymerase sigma-70 factor (ECF subfamily)